MNDFVVVIPSRLGSSRLKEKPLIDIAGKSLIQRVYERVQLCSTDQIYIATDSKKIVDHVNSFTDQVVMTDNDLPSGSDRVYQCAKILKLPSETKIINVQGDEPLIDPKSIDLTAKLLDTDNVDVATLCSKFPNEKELMDESNVKVTFSKNYRAQYFSRSIIPHNFTNQSVDYFKHIGIYGYSLKTLSEFVNTPISHLEELEKLEQLRFLENNFNIYLNLIEDNSIGVDTEADLKQVRNFFKK